MTRTIRKKIFDNDREDKTSQTAMQEEAKIRRKENRKERKLSDKDHKDYCDFGDMMPGEEESSTDGKKDGVDEKEQYAPDKWILTRHVLIRQHNKPRKHLFTPNEVDDDPSPIPFSSST